MKDDAYMLEVVQDVLLYDDATAADEKSCKGFKIGVCTDVCIKMHARNKDDLNEHRITSCPRDRFT